MKYDIEELKEFIKFYIPHRADIEEELFRRYTEDGIKIDSSIFDTILDISVRDSIKHLSLEYSEEQLKEILESYARAGFYGELYIEEVFRESGFTISQEELDEIYLTKTLENVINELNLKE